MLNNRYILAMNCYKKKVSVDNAPNKGKTVTMNLASLTTCLQVSLQTVWRKNFLHFKIIFKHVGTLYIRCNLPSH